MASSRTGRDTPNSIRKLNRERISIHNLTSPHTFTPSISTSATAVASPDVSSRFTSLSTRTGNKGYRLNIIQQPTLGAAYGHYPLSRLPLAPALIVQLTVVDASDQPMSVLDEIPFYVATIQLLSEHAVPLRDPSDDPRMASAPESARRLLYGSLVSSSRTLSDLRNRRGLFFIFPDVSIRVEGRYRLGVSMTRLRDHEMTLISSGSVSPLAKVCSDAFDVVNVNNYVAPAPTQLSGHFLLQGVPKA